MVLEITQLCLCSTAYNICFFSSFGNKARSYVHAVQLAIFVSSLFRAYAGIVGFVDVPYLVLEPTHNKQDFADAKV